MPIVHSAFIETKFARADLSLVEADGTFAGYASLFGKADLGRDMVMPGAFRGSLARRGVAGVKLLFQHDPAEPIGVWQEIREDGRGLFVKGRLNTDVARAREVLSLMRSGALDGLSIGYRTIRGETDRKMPVPLADVAPGDVILFRWRENLPAKHAAILVAPDRFVHAHQGAAVASAALTPWWRRRAAFGFGFPGVGG